MIRDRPYYSAWRHEFDDLIGEMESQFYSLLEGLETTPLLPGKEFRGRMLPAIRGDIRVDVQEHDDEIVVIADLPGVEKENVSVALLDPTTLELSCERSSEQEETHEGYYMKERSYGSMSRIIRLPVEVIASDATTSFTNGVLEVRLKRNPMTAMKKIIPVE